MKVLFITSWYPSKLDSTNGNFVERHALAVLSGGHQVVVVHEAFSNRVFLPSIGREGSADLTVFQVYMPRLLKNVLFFRKLMGRRLLKRLSKEGFAFDIIHGHIIHPVGPFVRYISDFSGVPFVFTEHWSGFLPANSGNLSAHQVQEIRNSAKACSSLMPVSENLAASMKGLGIQGPYRVVYNAVDTEIYHYKPEEKNDPFTFLHVSNFAKGVKNVEGIINAFAAFCSGSDMAQKLIIAGDGDLDSIRNYVIQNHPDLKGIHFLGTQTYAGVAALMQSAHCFVLFSNYENLPCVIAESHCCGMPVIGTHVGGVPEMINASNGVLVEPGNERELIAAMQKVTEGYSSFDPEAIQDMAHKRYGYRTIAEQFEEVYIDVLEKAQAKSQ